MPISIHHLSLGCAALILASCSSLPRKDALADLRQQTGARLGRDVSVPSSRAETADAARRIAVLLKRPLTSETSVEIALLNNRRLRATLEDVGIAHAELVEAATLSNPTLASSVRFPSGGGGSNPEFGLAADVLNWLLTPLRARMAARELEKTRRLVSHEILTLAAETKAAFYEAQAQAQYLGRLKIIAEVSDATADIAKRIHDAGNINDLELLTQQTGSLQTQLDIKRARAGSANARAKLNRLMGLGEGAWTLAGDLPPLPSGDPALARIVAVAMQQRQDLAAAREHVVAMEQALSLKRRTRLVPAVNLGVNTERELDGTQLTGPTLDIEVPLFNWGRASVKKLEAELRQAQTTQEALEAEVRNDVESAHSTLTNSREATVHLRDVLLPQRQRILKETLLHYNAMQKSNFELLLAKKEEQEAEQQFIESLRDYWVARAELEKAAGGSLTPMKIQTAAMSTVPSKKADSTPQSHAHHH